jgi:hypothetical protein
MIQPKRRSAMYSCIFIWLLLSFLSLSSNLPDQTNQTSITNNVAPQATVGDAGNATASIKPLRLTNATSADVDKARKIVKEAIAEAGKRNLARLAKPLRNNYGLAPGTILSKRDLGDVTPLLEITDEIAAAAALVAEADVAQISGNFTISKNQTTIRDKRPSKFWIGNLAHSGGWPFGNKSQNWPVSFIFSRQQSHFCFQRNFQNM